MRPMEDADDVGAGADSQRDRCVHACQPQRTAMMAMNIGS